MEPQNIEMTEHTLTTRTRERRRTNAANNDRTRPLQPTTTTVTASSSQRLAQHMTIAGSFLDFALFVADVEHLKYLLDAGKENIRYYNLLIILITSSLIIQIIVVILLFIVGFKRTESTTVTHHRDSYISNDEYEDQKAAGNYAPNPNFVDQISLNDPGYLNKTIIILVTIIAIINVFVTVFGDRSSADLIQKYRSGFNITEF